MPTRNIRDGELIVTDGNAQTVTLDLEDSGLSWEETRAVINVLDRGDLSHMRQGDEVPVTGSIGLKFQQFYGNASTPSLREIFTRTGNATAWSSTNADGGDVYTVSLVFNIYDVDSSVLETITFNYVCLNGAMSFAEGDEYDTFTAAFQDHEVAPTVAAG